MARRRNQDFEVQGTVTEAFDDLRAGYSASRENRWLPKLTGSISSGSGADYHFKEGDHLRFIERARMMDRENMLVAQGVDRVVTNILQDGINLDVQTSDDTTNKRLAEYWYDYGTDPYKCHSRGMLTLHRIGRLVLRAAIVDGDCLVLPLKSGQIEPIEAHRLRTPKTTQNVVNGVKLDNLGRPVEYWVAPEGYSSYSPPKYSEIQRYAARDAKNRPQVFHVLNPRRLSQTRGMSVFHPICFALSIHDDLQFAQLVKAQIAASYTIFRQQGLNVPPSPTAQRGAQTTETMSDGATRVVQGVSPGLEITGKAGETLTGFSPNVPNPEFFQHAMMIMGIIAVNLNMPVAMLLLDPSQTNFSGWRGAVDQARFSFRDFQDLMISLFYRPIYHWKLEQWTALDPELMTVRRTMGDADFFAHQWNPPTWPYIEPTKDAQSDELRLKANLISDRRLQAERGRDYEDLLEEIVADRAKLARRAMVEAQAINGEFPEAKIGWRELARWEAAEAPAAVAEKDKDESDPEEQEANKQGRDKAHA